MIGPKVGMCAGSPTCIATGSELEPLLRQSELFREEALKVLDV